MIRDPEHPILPRAWEYDVVGLNLQFAPDNEDEPFLDLTLQRDREQRVLRFWSPQQLTLEEGALTTHGMVIEDVRYRRLEGLGVHVNDFEVTNGGLRFRAGSVEERRDQR